MELIVSFALVERDVFFESTGDFFNKWRCNSRICGTHSPCEEFIEPSVKRPVIKCPNNGQKP